jgi:glyoxylase-like metal-dependent hydrolase (beta-lactamase superfamily II)
MEVPGIYRLKIPFDTVYTSVFLIEADGARILVDCATTPTDVKNFIVPALAERGLSLSDVDFLVLTHTHGDHAGGLDTVLSIAPDVEVVRESDMRELAPKIYTYALPGHTLDLTGVLDTRTNTLISGDGIQGAGVDKYRCYLENKDAYIWTLQKLLQDERVENILFSHAYEPWYKDSVCGRDVVQKCLSDCFEFI